MRCFAMTLWHVVEKWRVPISRLDPLKLMLNGKLFSAKDNCWALGWGDSSGSDSGELGQGEGR